MPDTPTDPFIGTTVSQYEVVAKLGGGGMGVVYKAKGTKLGRWVALKFLPPQWSHDAEAKQRFIREAQAASATDHPHICVVHDIDETADGRLFIVMAFYNGETLKQKLEQGAVPVAEAVEIAAQIAEGLAKAHAQGVYHRDIKPANLMITEDGVRILDFGLAKFADSLQLTAPGSTIGTAAYMSPEQARGEEADARSDVWALGIVLYEMLSGMVPFKGPYFEATLHAIKTEPVPPLVVGPDEVPPALHSAVAKALEKDSSRRYQNARELARDLRLLQGRTLPLDLRTEALPLVVTRRASELTTRGRPQPWLTLPRVWVLVAALVATLGASYLWVNRPVVRIPVAILPVANHTGEPELDTYRLALTHTLVEELSDSPNVQVVPYLRLLEMIGPFVSAGTDVSSREVVEAITRDSGARFVVIPTLVNREGAWAARVEVRNASTGTNAASEETEAVGAAVRADTAYRLTLSAAERVQEYFKVNGPGRSYSPRPAAARLRTPRAALAFELGLRAYEQGEYAEAVAAFERAVAEDGQHALAHAWMSRVWSLMGHGEEAAAAAQRVGPLLSSDLSEADVTFARGLAAEGRRDAAAAASLYQQLAGMPAATNWAQTELAGFLKRQSRNREAIEAYHASLSLDPGAIRPHVDLCQLYVRSGEHPLAEKSGSTALERYRATGHRSGEAQARLCLADALAGQGGARLPDARRHAESARAIFESLNHPYGLARAQQYLGRISGTERDYRGAIIWFERALPGSRQLRNRSLEGLTLMNLGVAAEALGQVSRALAYYAESRDVFQLLGEERGAAEQDVNIAALSVTYGTGQAEALRRLAAARVTLDRLGAVFFDLVGLQVEAEAQFHAARHAEARRQLVQGLQIARQRTVNRIPQLTVALSQSYLLLNEYESARTLLEELRATDTGRADLATRLALGRTLARLGQFEAASELLETSGRDIEATGQLRLLPLAELALGELAYEMGDPTLARQHFGAASKLWTGDELPDAASVESRCALARLDAQAGGVAQARARALAQAGLERAAAMQQKSLERQCQLDLARVLVADRRHDAAVALLSTAESSLGPELEAMGQYWRGRALAAQGRLADERVERERARAIMSALRDSLPERFRGAFGARPDVRLVLDPAP